MARGAIALLSSENLLHNYNIIKNIAPKSKLMPMIKANAYGHGIRSVAKILANCDNFASFGVASIEEALALRHVGIENSITLMEGVFEPDELPIVLEQNFDVVVHNELQVQWLKELPITNKKINVWLKIDTGMGRLGFNPELSFELYNYLSQINSVNHPIGIMSHFACADEANNDLNKKQLIYFNNYIKNLPGPKSLCNSAGIFNFPEHHYDIVRPGIVLYGISPIKGKSIKELNLKPVMSLWSKLIAVKTIAAGNYIGYGARYLCTKDTKIGIIALGYGDGYPITARDGTPVSINGKICNIVGRVAMDMISVDLTNCPEAKIGDTVELWGNDLPLEEIVPNTNNISYDLITNIQYRVKFKWI